MKICGDEIVKSCAALDTMAAAMSSMAETEKKYEMALEMHFLEIKRKR